MLADSCTTSNNAIAILASRPKTLRAESTVTGAFWADRRAPALWAPALLSPLASNLPDGTTQSTSPQSSSLSHERVGYGLVLPRSSQLEPAPRGNLRPVSGDFSFFAK